MKLFKKPIFVSTSPNAESDDVWTAFKLLFTPWQWQKGPEPEKFTEEFRNYLGVENVFLFDSGRTSIYALLLALDLKKDEEVLVQAFTCAAAVNPILWFGAHPVYVDIEKDTYNMDPLDLEKKISPKSRILFVQHTFGMPARIDELMAIAKKHNLFVIEDAAHSLGAEHKGKKLGTFGDAAIFSFGRYKIISSVFGGAAVCRDDALGKRLEDLYQKWSYPSRFWIFEQLFHPVLLFFSKPFYNIWGLGKVPVVLARKLGLISLTVYTEEKRGGRPGFGPSIMPNALAILGRRQFRKLEDFNKHRRQIAGKYAEGLKNAKFILPRIFGGSLPVFLTFPIQIEKDDLAGRLIKASREDEGVYLENWPAKKVIGPPGTDLQKLEYKSGLCPVAEKVALRVVTLPTNIHTDEKDAERVNKLILDFFKSS